MVEFTWEYNIEKWTEADYRDFIRRLIVRLGVRFSHNRPTLDLQSNPRTFFDLVLRTNDRSVRFRFQTNNLYLIGYQMENDNWLEFGLDNEDQNLITEPGTNFLGFRGNYDGLSTAGDRILQNTRVGFLNLVSAINQLAVTTDREARARNLVVVIMMISEATRFIPVLDHFAPSFNPRNISDGGEPTIPVWLENLVKSWKKLSAKVLYRDAYPDVATHRFTLPEDNYVVLQPGSRRLETIADILTILGIMLGLCFNPDRPKGRITSANDDDGKCFIGLPFVQVFSVQINNIDDENPGELFGTIVLDDGLRTDYIYNRTRSNYESIKPGDYATLTGPSEAVSAVGDFTMRLLLTDKDNPGSWFDDVIMNDVISWDSSNLDVVYDKLISKQLHSSRGSVTVNYAVMRNAVAARVTIIFQQGGGERTVEVYGHVYGSYTNWVEDDPKTTTSVLFERSSGDYVSVNRWEEIPLLRSVVAVPLDDSLKVTALLYDYDTFSADDVIANGTIEFPVPETIPSTSQNYIPGEGNKNYVTVVVQWSYGYF